MSQYREFLIANSALINQIERTISSSSYFLPGRFHNSHIVAAALFSVVSLYSSYNDTILLKTRPASQYNAHILALFKSSALYKNASHLLKIISTTDTVVEMVTNGNTKVLLFLESLKSLLRLFLLLKRGGSRNVGEGLVRDYDLNTISTSPGFKKLGRSGKLIPRVKDVSSDGSRYLEAKAVACEPSGTAVRAVVGKAEYAGEVLLAAKGLLYILSLRRWGKTSWKPWMVGFVIETMSLLSWYSPSTKKPRADLTKLEQEEFSRRRFALLYYLLRDPMYSAAVKEKLSGIIKSLEGRMLLGFFGGLLGDYKELLEQYYFTINR